MGGTLDVGLEQSRLERLELDPRQKMMHRNVHVDVYVLPVGKKYQMCNEITKGHVFAKAENSLLAPP